MGYKIVVLCFVNVWTDVRLSLNENSLTTCRKIVCDFGPLVANLSAARFATDYGNGMLP